MYKSENTLSLILPLGTGMIVSFASSYYLLGVMAEPVAAATGTTTHQLFAALSGAFFIAACSSMVSGKWIDRRGGREVLVAAALMLAFALTLLALAQTAVMALVGVLALGFGMGVGFYAPANALLVSVYGAQARKPITAVSLMGACGGAIGWPLTLALVEWLGWRGACGVWALAHVLVCIPLYRFYLPRGVVAIAPNEVGTPVRWDRRMVQMALLFAGAWWVATACAAQLPRLMQALGLTPAGAAMAASAMALSALGMRVLALLAPSRASPLHTVRFATLLHPVGVLVAMAGGKAASVAVAIGQGAGNGLLSVASGVLPLHVFGKENYGQRQVAVLLPARFVQAIAPLSFGLALDRSAGFALGLTSAVCLVMFALTLGLEAKGRIASRIMAQDRA